MDRVNQYSQKSSRKGQRRLQRALAALFVVGLLAGASPSAADEYDPHRAGHPLRMAAYVLYPVGFVVDWLVMRPAHWIGSRPFLKEMFGHTD